MSRAIPVRNIFREDIDISKLRRDIVLLFEDNETIACRYKEVIIFRYLLSFLNEFKEIEITSDIWITNYMENGYFNYDTYTKLYSRILHKFIEKSVKPTENVDLIPKLLKAFYVTMNNLPRVLKGILPEYVIGIELMDILEVQFKEKLLSSIAEVHKNPTQDNIEHTYEVMDSVIKNDLPNTNLIKLVYLSKMVNANQIKQLLGSRGFITEINSTIFKIPMCNSFTLGAKNLYEITIESRNGAKAMFLSNTAIQQSEYLARELQLVTMYVEKLEFTDCGNRDYHEFYIKGDEYADGQKIHNSDLPNLIGKHYFDDDGKEKIITKDSKHLENTTVKLRSALHCKLRDKKAICSHCFGELAYSIFKHQNLGHITTTNITRSVTQSLLSTKHLTVSASATKIVLKEPAAQFFNVKSGDKLYLVKKFLGRKTKALRIVIPQNQVKSFSDVIRHNDILSINLIRSSRLSKVLIEEVGNNETKSLEIDIKVGNRYGILTVHFWNYLLKHGYDLSDNNDYIVDLTEWDAKNPFIQYEKKEYDFSMLNRQFKTLLRKRKYYKDKVTGERVAEFKPEVLVEKLFSLLNTKVNANIALLEVMVYAFTAEDINNNNYDLARNAKKPNLIGLKNAIDNRSLGASLNWNKLDTKVYSPELFARQHKPEHVLDVLFKPNKVLKDFKR